MNVSVSLAGAAIGVGYATCTLVFPASRLMHPAPQIEDDGSGGEDTVQPGGRSISNWAIVPQVYATGRVMLSVPPANT